MITLKEDKLKREELLKNIFSIFSSFGNQDGHGFTMLINGKYGEGKSTLLNFIKEKNSIENNKFNVVLYNAWESNYFENPIIPLMHTLSKLKSNGKNVENAAKKVIKALPISFLRTVANLTKIDATALAEKETNEFDNFDRYQKAVNHYKCVFKEYCSNKKTIFLVDELDRCLPEYQIKVLECIYHLLNIPNLIVVIAMDKDQLDASVKNKFGHHIDTYQYLSKFIQYEIDLPKNNTYDYVQSLMTFNVQNPNCIKPILAEMFKSIDLPLRDSKIIIQKLNLICKEKNDPWGKSAPYPFHIPPCALFLVLLKYTNRKIYAKHFGKHIKMFHINEKHSFKNTSFYNFLIEIEKSNFKNIIYNLFKNNFGKIIVLDLINLFDNVENINEEELADYLNISVEDVKKIIFEGQCRPCLDIRNWLLEKIDIIL